MPTPVLMPQMGESIAEGTIVRWIKKVGDTVDRDEPLFEISTDKVDAEIPSPAAGILTEISVNEGETVPVNSIVATIGATMPGEVPVMASVMESAVPAGVTQVSPPVSSSVPPSVWSPTSTSVGRAHVGHREHGGASPAGVTGIDDLRRTKSSPLVRRIARDHRIDIGQIRGSGASGRVTKTDILAYIETRPAAPAPARVVQAYRPDDHVEIKPLSVMRKKIAEHMVLSRRTSAHVHTVFHVDFSTVDRIRQEKKAEYEQAGTKLTFTGFITMALVDALRRFPILNASLDGDNIVYKQDINIGIAVALESGLIVPVVKNAGQQSMLALSRAIGDIAERARTKQLKPEDVQGGTFTITNPGNFGAQFGMPIINQPQVGILGIGTIEKRAVVVDDAIAIRVMGYLTLGFDHRLVDGATADQFMADIKGQIERFEPARV